MNIFYTNECPIQAANEHNYIHQNKMQTEYIQVLSTVKRIVEGVKRKMPVLNKKTGAVKVKDWYLIDSDTVVDGVVVDTEIFAASHVGNRFVNWAMASLANYEWLWMCAAQLSSNWLSRRGKAHGSSSKLYALADTPNIPKLAHLAPPVADSVSSFVKSLHGVKAHVQAMVEKFSEWQSRAKPMKVEFDTVPHWYAA